MTDTFVLASWAVRTSRLRPRRRNDGVAHSPTEYHLRVLIHVFCLSLTPCSSPPAMTKLMQNPTLWLLTGSLLVVVLNTLATVVLAVSHNEPSNAAVANVLFFGCFACIREDVALSPVIVVSLAILQGIRTGRKQNNRPERIWKECCTVLQESTVVAVGAAKPRKMHRDRVLQIMLCDRFE